MSAAEAYIAGDADLRISSYDAHVAHIVLSGDNSAFTLLNTGADLACELEDMPSDYKLEFMEERGE